MIRKEKDFGKNKLIWYQKEDMIYLYKFDENWNAKIIRKIPDYKKRKKERLKNIVIAFICIVLLKQIHEITTQPEYSTMISWDYLSEDAKQSLIQRKIKEALKENENIPLEIKLGLIDSYEEYLEECSKYINRRHYLKILESSQTVNFELLEKPIQKSENLTTNGWYNLENNTIYCINNANMVFHEKLHTDYGWKIETADSTIYNEMHSSLFAKIGYEDIDAAFRMIGELVGNEVLAKNLIEKTPEKIWEELVKLYPEKEKMVYKLQNLVETIYQKEYLDLKDIQAEKNEFWSRYRELYYEKYQMLPETDIIGSFLKDRFFSNTFLRTNSMIEYENTYLIENIEIPLENRNRNYKDVIIETLFASHTENALYFQELWEETMIGIHKRNNFSYQELENSLEECFSKEVIDDLFKKMITCNTEERCIDLIKWIHINIYSIYRPEIEYYNTESLTLEKKK